mmetsp:Transcript_18021/g.17202  ORF Transcript_18021/g.17202 Transcript_18021/m.17202 type:complete len:88 (+) Transcript_18021:274-537(+)
MFNPFYTATIFPVINFFEGHSFEKSKQDLKEKYFQTWIISIKVWVPANLINFTFVPIPYQLLFVNFVQLFYNGFLSYMHNSYEAPTE